MSDDNRPARSPHPPSEPDFSTVPISGFAGNKSPRAQFTLTRHRSGYSKLASNVSEPVAEDAEEQEQELPQAYSDNTYKNATSDKPVAAEGIAAADSRSIEERGVGDKEDHTSVGAAEKRARISLPGCSSPRVGHSRKSSKTSIQGSSPQVVSPLSPEPARHFPRHDPSERLRHIPNGEDARQDDVNNNSRPSLLSYHQRSMTADSYEGTDALKINAGAPSPSENSPRSAYDRFDPRDGCPAYVSFEHSRNNWFGITMFVLSIFSTVFSGIYFVVAVIGPRYGHTIGTNAQISSSTASILTTLFAKLIELSFVTVFIAFIGQALSRRAFMSRERGVSLAELYMRTWVQQPGSMISNPETLRYAGWTVLGAFCIFAASCALLYTTAADALVAPQLSFGDWRNKLMQGPVRTSFANVQFMQSQCLTPIRVDTDPDGLLAIGGSCNQITHAADSYHNYQKYLGVWDSVVRAGNGSTDMASRPAPYALLHENTTVTGAWVNVVDVAEASKKAGGRIVNNVSLAMPHAGVSLAAYDERNTIMQPSELDGLGIYKIRASVPSPMMNVLCANVDDTDIKDIVYETSAEGKRNPLNFSSWPTLANFSELNDFKIKTPLDDLFGWGNDSQQHPPMFFKKPLPYNTLLNQTFQYGRNAIYLLGKGGPSQNDLMFMCSLKTTHYPGCSTNFTATASGARLDANCDKPSDSMAYIKSIDNAAAMPAISLDWPWVAGEWGTSVSLNDGINDGNSSNARLLTDLALQQPSLNPALPSPAEALAVMAGSTLLTSSLHAPFVPFWNYTQNTLDEPQYQFLNATIQAQEYASGGTFRYQRAFFPVLFAVFLINILVLVYFVVHKGMVTDYSDPANLFTLAVNSPPSHLLAGSCGGGPEGEQFKVNWRVMNAGNHLYMTSEQPKGWKGHPYSSSIYEMSPNNRSSPYLPINRSYSKFSKRTTLL